MLLSIKGNSLCHVSCTASVDASLQFILISERHRVCCSSDLEGPDRL
jgi:hypothetical protein